MSSGRPYHSHHQSERRDAQKQHDHDLPQPQAPESFGLGLGDDHPPAAAATSPAPDPESNTALTMTATKKRRMPDNYAYAQSHLLYPYQMQMQESSIFQVQGWNEERSSAFASMPNTHKDEEEALSTDKEAGKKPGPDPQKGGDPNPINDMIIRNNPYLPRRFQFFSPSHEQFHHFHPPQKHEHPDNNLLPLAAPYSPMRRQFGNEHYMSPRRPAPAAAAHSKKDPPASAVATEEAKMKATRDDGTKDLVHADLPPTFPNLSVKGVRTSPSSGSTSWDRKFNELERPAPSAHLKKDPLPSAAVVATEETKMKANSDGGEDSTDLPPPLLPFLPVKGICTSTSSQRNAWDRKFDELIDFKQQHGHCDVPQTYAPNPKLGVWVNK
eukprot:scaffold5223_cov84-Skeletonema_dohrnii-CCMP3373.AAC.1